MATPPRMDCLDCGRECRAVSVQGLGCFGRKPSPAFSLVEMTVAP